MKTAIIDLLIRPDVFFRNAMTQKANLKIPALIVLGGGFVGAAYGYLVGGVTARMMSGAVPGIESIIALTTVIGAVLGTILFWILWAGVFYILSALFPALNEKEGFTRTLEFVGYGYLPQIGGSLFALTAAGEFLPKVVVPRIPAGSIQDPVIVQETMKALMQDPAMMELTRITTVISIVFLLWSASIWIVAMRHARQLSPRDAALCVGIPVVAYIFYAMYTMVAM